MRSKSHHKIERFLEQLTPTLRAMLAEHFAAEAATRRPVFRERPGDTERAAEVDDVTRARARVLLKKGSKR